MTTVKQEWDKFAAHIKLPEEETVQHQEMRRAFFAGQWAMFMFQMNELATASDKAAELGLMARQRELESFFENFSTRN